MSALLSFRFLEPPSEKTLLELRTERARQERKASTLKLSAAYASRPPSAVIIGSGELVPHLENPFLMHYHLAPSLDAAVAEVLREPRASAANYFCMIEDDKPAALYFDFDAPAQRFADTEHFHYTVCLALHYMEQYLRILYEPTLRMQHWLYDASVAGKKWSTHAHTDVVFGDVLHMRRLAKDFVELVRTVVVRCDTRMAAFFYQHTSKGANPVTTCRSILDPRVYTRRPFRLPYCAKTPVAGNALLPLLPDVCREEDVCRGFVHHGLPASAPRHVYPPPSFVLAANKNCIVQRARLRLCQLGLDDDAAEKEASEFWLVGKFNDRLGFVQRHTNLPFSGVNAAQCLCSAYFGELEAFARFVPLEQQSYALFVAVRGDLARLCHAAPRQLGMLTPLPLFE